MENKKLLIDANKLIDFIDVGHLRHPGELCYSEVDVANILLHAPTVDAVPVVRCRECKYWGDEDGKLQRSDGVLFARCKVHNYLLDGRHTGWCPMENDFCYENNWLAEHKQEKITLKDGSHPRIKN